VVLIREDIWSLISFRRKVDLLSDQSFFCVGPLR
jgi:hypothetical protein